MDELVSPVNVCDSVFQKATESDRHKQVNTKYRKYGKANADVNEMQYTLHKVQKQRQHKQ